MTKFHPKEVLLELLPFLGTSRAFAIYYPNIEVCVSGPCRESQFPYSRTELGIDPVPFSQPLVEAYQACRGLGNIIRLELFETWTRPYQVLPLRTHPAMVMNANSGYVLAGIKVAADQPVPFSQAPLAKRQKV